MDSCGCVHLQGCMDSCGRVRPKVCEELLKAACRTLWEYWNEPKLLFFLDSP